MADKIIRLNEGYPITHEDAVLDNNGTTIGSKVRQLQNDVADKVVEADKVQQILEDIKGSGDVPAATVAQVAVNTGKLSELEVKTYGFNDSIIIPVDKSGGLRNVSSITGEFVPTTTANHYAMEIALEQSFFEIKINNNWKASGDYGFAFLANDDTFVSGQRTTGNDVLDVKRALNLGATKVRVSVASLASIIISRFQAGDIPIVQEDITSLKNDIKEIEDKAVESTIDEKDFSISNDKGESVLIINNGHIKTKNFDSANLRVKTNKYNTLGSPSIFIPQSTSTAGLATFSTLDELYSAWDELAQAHPDWLKRESDIGLDESGTYPIRHYVLRMQYPLVTDDRGATGENRWDDSQFKYRRILLNIGIHPDEAYSTLGGYLAIKEILESDSSSSSFIKNNFIVDIIPMYNVYGMAHLAEGQSKSHCNVNGINLNRDFRAQTQNETKSLVTLIDQLISKGLVGIIDLHNTGLGIEASGESYFVTKTDYKLYAYYCRLTQMINAALNDFLASIFGTSGKNHFHTWNYISEGASNVGQLHEYADTMNLLGCSFEIATGAGLQGAIATKAIAINLIEQFGTFEDE